MTEGADPCEASHRDSLGEAAIHAEYESGHHETSEQAAKAHIAVRLVRMTVGSIIVLGGIIMMPLPGPGLPLVAVGLAVLARDVAWADRLLGHVRARIPTEEDGGLTRGVLITAAVSGLAGISFSIWLIFVH